MINALMTYTYKYWYKAKTYWVILVNGVSGVCHNGMMTPGDTCSGVRPIPVQVIRCSRFTLVFTITASILSVELFHVQHARSGW